MKLEYPGWAPPITAVLVNYEHPPPYPYYHHHHPLLRFCVVCSQNCAFIYFLFFCSCAAKQTVTCFYTSQHDVFSHKCNSSCSILSLWPHFPNIIRCAKMQYCSSRVWFPESQDQCLILCWTEHPVLHTQSTGAANWLLQIRFLSREEANEVSLPMHHTLWLPSLLRHTEQFPLGSLLIWILILRYHFSLTTCLLWFLCRIASFCFILCIKLFL